QSHRGRVVNSNDNSSLRIPPGVTRLQIQINAASRWRGAPGAEPARRELGTRSVIAQEKGRRSTSGSGPSLAPPPPLASAMASSSGVGAAAANLNAVRETMDDRHLWRSSQGTRQGRSADGPILGESFLRSWVVCREYGVADPLLLEISRILNTGLDMETLSICVRLCEQGINPEALSSVIKELRKAAEALKVEIHINSLSKDAFV
ncbi:hypothetical protein J1605_005786, partial [Eschrichtius robustus]